MTDETKKLFACYLGWRVKGCHIEMHDVQFSVGKSIEDCYEDLESKWIGTKPTCHIDAFLELKYVDGYEIVLASEPQNRKKTNVLYFINAGAYDPKKFGELHEVWFYVAKSRGEATRKALEKLCIWKDKKHQDDMYDIDDCIAIEKVRDHYIHLQKTNKVQDFSPMYYGYGTLDKKLSEKIIHKNF